MQLEDTICAVSTPSGMGGIGIVRLSGPDAVGVLARIFARKDASVGNVYKSHRIYYGHVVDNRDSSIVDEALVSVMLAPKTYTREDIVEINCHGGPAAVRKVLELCVSYGARLAEAGEFTRRAYLNGRIDLTQAEAVMDIISSSTELSLAAAMNQLKGGLRERILLIREDIATLLALTELSIDFADEEVDYVPLEGLKERGAVARDRIDALLSTYDDGRLLREGLRLAIVGSPNVGKSSLLNLLTRSDRAIVTELPGTTRDTIEEMVNIGGVPVRLIDTAGIRESADVVEREGIRRSKDAIKKADLILLVLDGSRALMDDDRDIIQTLQEGSLLISENARFITVINKSDLNVCINPAELPADDVVSISAKHGTGIDELTRAIKRRVLSGGLDRPPEASINLRHKRALEAAQAAVERFMDGCSQGLSQEFLALELHDALGAVGEVVGETTPDDILNRIFGDFCIGK